MKQSQPRHNSASRWTKPWLLIVYGIALLFLLDALLFRTGIYRRYLDPESTAGQLYRMASLKRARDVDNAIAVCGDSRVAEGFSAKTADESGARGGVPFINIAIPGTTPRVWYYLLREIDPGANRFSAVVIMLSNYDEDTSEDLNERTLDLNYLSPILRYTDAFSLPGTFSNPDARIHALAYTLLRGTAFKQDILDFLSHPVKRLRLAAIYRKHWRNTAYNYAGRAESLAGLAPDPAVKGGLVFPPNVKPELKPPLQSWYDDMNERQPMEHDARYRELWLGKIAERYRNSRTKLIIFQIPRGPMYYLKPPGEIAGALAGLEQKYHFTVLPPDSFTSLERPEFFFDHFHMNTTGRQRFSQELAALVRPMAAAPAQPVK